MVIKRPVQGPHIDFRTYKICMFNNFMTWFLEFAHLKNIIFVSPVLINDYFSTQFFKQNSFSFSFYYSVKGPQFYRLLLSRIPNIRVCTDDILIKNSKKHKYNKRLKISYFGSLHQVME